MLFGKTAAGGAADLYRLELLAVLDAAADVKDDLPQGGAHGDLNEAGVYHVAGEGEGLGAGALLGADGAVPLGAVADDEGDGGEGLHVVENRRLGPQAVLHGTGRLHAGHAPVALDGGSQGAALAADEGAGTPVYMEMEGEVGAQDVVAQQAQLLRPGDGVAQAGHGQGVLGADVDVALIAARRHAGNEHALDDGVGVALHDGAVHEGAGVALVAVTHHVLLALGLLTYALPLASGGEAAAAPAPQTGVQNFLTDGLVGHLKQSLFKGGIAVLGQIFVNILGIGGAAVFQHDAVLLVIEGDVLMLFVGHAVQLVEQPGDHLAPQQGLLDDVVAVLHLHVGVENAVGLNLQQGTHLAEAVAAAALEVDVVGLGLRSLILPQKAHMDVEPPALTLLLHPLIDVERAAGDTAGTGADEYLAALCLQSTLGLHLTDLQLVPGQFSCGHGRPPPFSGTPADRWPAPGSF